MEQLAAKLGYKSLKRAYWGEMPLPDSKIRHIEDLRRLHKMELHIQGSYKLGTTVTPKTGAPDIVAESVALRGKTIPSAITSEAPVLREEPTRYADLQRSLLSALTPAVLHETAQRLIQAGPSEINFSLLRDILEELERRIQEARQHVADLEAEKEKRKKGKNTPHEK